MKKRKKNPAEIVLTDTSLSMSARVIYAWMHFRHKTNVTILEVSRAMGMHRATAAIHMNSLGECGVLELIIIPGTKGTHSWELKGGSP